MPYCHKCDAQAPDCAKFCMRCGTQLIVIHKTTARVPSEPCPSPGRTLCGNCGKELRFSLPSCPHCGWEVPAGIAVHYEPCQENKSQREETAGKQLSIAAQEEKGSERQVAKKEAVPELAASATGQPQAMPKRTDTRMGTGLGIVGALTVLVGFFLPWVRSCAREMSGWQLASESMIQGKEQFYLTPIVAVLSFLFLIWVVGRAIQVRGQVARISMVLSTMGLLPPLDVLFIAYGRGKGTIELLYGLWVTLGGFAAMLVGAVMDLFAAATAPTMISPVCARCETENPPDNRYCQRCGSCLIVGGDESPGLRVCHIGLAIVAGVFALLMFCSAAGWAADPEEAARAAGLYGSFEDMGAELMMMAIIVGAGIVLSFVVYRQRKG